MAWKRTGTGYPEQIDPASGDYGPAFEAVDYPGTVGLRGRAIWDTPVYNNFGGTGKGTVGPSDQGSAYATPVRELVVTNEPLLWWPASENVTRWNPWVEGPNGYSQGGEQNQGTAIPVEPLVMSSHPMNGTGNFFMSDPSLWGASLSMQTDWDHMALGGTVMLGHQSFARSPGQAQFSPEFYPSTVYEPAPAWGSVQPKAV